ncbi:hypothetical protein FJTKL_12032 [Diaporthe vaccinii]|uniref:Secreted protein n=1 Tax=Diaporthe vaccinii TaxID=105482 RepID=A0ABR4FAY5_9PEZI
MVPSFSQRLFTATFLYLLENLPAVTSDCHSTSSLWNELARHRSTGLTRDLSIHSTSFTGAYLTRLSKWSETLTRRRSESGLFSELPVPSLPSFYRHRIADAFSPFVLA